MHKLERWLNDIYYNYWSDWTTPDANSDKLVDIPYLIEGTANNQDQYPLVSSLSVHYLTSPAFIFPSGGELLSGIVTIYWMSSIDTWGYLVSYSLYYSNDSGVTWNLLVMDLTVTSYDWQTGGVLDGSNYLLKVEAISSGGLFGTSTTPGPVTIDNILPTIIIVSPSTHNYTTNTVTITLMGNAAHFWYYIESVDSQNQTWTSDVTRTLTDGVYTLHAYGNDSVGNIGHVSVTFTIETTVPTTVPTTTTTTTTTPTKTVTPGWDILFLLFSFIGLIALRQRNKKS